jgi:RimJ/RimL family protein N-acetyltransferase
LIEIKFLPEDRWKEARELRLEALKTEPSAFGSSVEEEERLTEAEWRERTKNALVALSDGRLVGTITYIFSHRVKTKHVAYIYGFYVGPDYRGQGFGRKLLEAALKNIGENKSIVKVQLQANPKQEAAIALYKSAGFQVVGELKKEMKIGGEYHNELVMEKYLER